LPLTPLHHHLLLLLNSQLQVKLPCPLQMSCYSLLLLLRCCRLCHLTAALLLMKMVAVCR
jgi:hypothetical protein